MTLDTQFRRSAPPTKPKSAQEAELLGGFALSAQLLRARPDAAKLAALLELLSNAEYWLSFDVAAFEPLLARSPSPLRELGVGVALRFGEGVDGRLSASELAAFQATLGELPEDVRTALQLGIASLGRAIAAREAQPRFEADGYAAYKPAGGMSAHALMASASRSQIEIQGAESKRGNFEAQVGVPLRLSAADERGRPLDAPDVESDLGAPVLAKSEDRRARSVILLIPGRYRVRVHGRGDERQLLVR